MLYRVKKGSAVALLVIMMCISQMASATLVERAGGQAFYDTVLDITWLTNVNLAQSEDFGVAGIRASGLMTLDTANEWIGAMNSAGYLGLDTWRLPSITPINGAMFNRNWSVDGSTDRAQNVSAAGSAFAGSTASEIAHLYFNTLGNISKKDVSGGDTPCSDPTVSCLSNTGPFTGLLNEAGLNNSRTWSSANPFEDGKVMFFNFNGNQNEVLPNELIIGSAWAVASGDALVPIPAAVWLFASGIGLLVGWNRKQQVRIAT
ncbi:MAG: hypothetical protein GY727_16070 [Gammaproteobacteria bacterium]|nr:hypothetical protein [Gammaproteobacteria bacterium]MCP4089156.1 hypothetical protein [Gammaproteobacteria bacterium]MCP4276820.1 hypothetical protein [Gammaproteobacteria bacterium]MCP4830663.1 hypothetical protein [Gammaproteobacteria bacterium]MCP4928472.1 hypothetical protein [Gammaproteobacteria bacterium]